MLLIDENIIIIHKSALFHEVQKSFLYPLFRLWIQRTWRCLETIFESNVMHRTVICWSCQIKIWIFHIYLVLVKYPFFNTRSSKKSSGERSSPTRISTILRINIKQNLKTYPSTWLLSIFIIKFKIRHIL